MADPAPIEVMQRSGAASSGPIAEAATTLTADDIPLLADGPAGPHWVEPPVLGNDGNVLFRRNPPPGCVEAKDSFPRAP